MNPLVKGDITEIKITMSLISAGRTVVKPVNSGCRFDLGFIDAGGRFFTVQCKTGRLLDSNTIVFATWSFDNVSHVRKSYIGQVDFFGVHCPNVGCFLVPVNEVAETEGRLKLSGAGRLAEQYRLVGV